MDYTKSEFDKFLSRSQKPEGEISSDDTSIKIQPSSTQVQTFGKYSSETLSIDWDKGEIVFLSGSRPRVVVGKVEETNKYGIKIYNADGTVAFSELYS